MEEINPIIGHPDDFYKQNSEVWGHSFLGALRFYKRINSFFALIIPSDSKSQIKADYLLNLFLRHILYISFTKVVMHPSCCVNRSITIKPCYSVSINLLKSSFKVNSLHFITVEYLLFNFVLNSCS